MKRDMDLIRELLLRLESLPVRPGGVVLISGRDQELAVEGRSPDEVDYHLSLIKEASFIECPGSGSLDGRISFRRLTWHGHEFLDAIRDPEIWRKTKDSAKKAGSTAIDFMWSVAKDIAKAELKRHIGIDLG